ncbi:hypothetical protein HFRIS_014759 [Herbaspirillum frisingense GSF30]|uniref:Uncharacterized protein n=1 Tax=Herbaspirillum frisingense GSF30 TaxID=864073 RepID=A0AAI9IDF0_9BURK|nr:hypothetical protein HFRIS_014759 [Herbaspirillum frisingense GSF30]
MEQKRKFVNQIVEMERLNRECAALIASAVSLDMGVPIERQQCRDSMRALRTLLVDMRTRSLQVEMYIAEYSDLTAASNDNIK